MNRLTLIAILSLALLTIVPASLAASDAVLMALSARHKVASVEELKAVAGGEAGLISRLLELRHNEKLPFVAVRAEKILLQFADNDDVSVALEEDLRNPRMKGLARVIAVHIDNVSNDEIRRNLALLAVERAKSDSSFAPYAKSLKSSKDSEVAKLARKGLD